MPTNVDDIPKLLHDALLVGCHWDQQLATLDLFFSCLRRNTDGSLMEDSTVQLRMSGVQGILAYYWPANATVKPSEFAVHDRLRLAELEAWQQNPIDAHLTIESAQSEFDLQTSCVRELLFGQVSFDSPANGLRIHLSFEPTNYSKNGAAKSLLVECDSIVPLSNGVPLDLDLWREQFESWWIGWQDHWAENNSSPTGDGDIATEDSFIPIAQSTLPDLNYQPPSEQPFHVLDSSVPEELLKPIEDYVSGLRYQDWLRMASAYPYYDLRVQERAEQLRDEYLGDLFGRWLYVRHIDSWWQEGNRACVVARGIEHSMPDEETTAVNQETVITLGLRKHSDAWIIASWAQGWPRFGSAEELHEPQAWRDGWKLADSDEGAAPVWRKCLSAALGWLLKGQRLAPK